MLLLLLVPVILLAQEHKPDGTHETTNHHRVALMISHTHIPNGLPSVSGSGPLIVPSWGLTYNYRFNEKWTIALHTDMEVATYIIEDENGEQLQRTRPIIISFVGGYNLWKGIELAVGFGREFEEHHNFWVYKFGIEYNIELGNYWDIAPALMFDVKENLYDSWTLGLVVGKKF
jgi:hypothetical protein